MNIKTLDEKLKALEEKAQRIKYETQMLAEHMDQGNLPILSEKILEDIVAIQNLTVQAKEAKQKRNEKTEQILLPLKEDNPEKAAIAVFNEEITEHGRQIWQWLPRSLIDFTVDESGIASINMPKWLAVDKGFIGAE